MTDDDLINLNNDPGTMCMSNGELVKGIDGRNDTSAPCICPSVEVDLRTGVQTARYRNSECPVHGEQMKRDYGIVAAPVPECEAFVLPEGHEHPFRALMCASCGIEYGVHKRQPMAPVPPASEQGALNMSIQPGLNYNAATREGRRNILMRIFEDNGIEFKEDYVFNSEPWIEKLFNGGRFYQRRIDERNVEKYFTSQQKVCIGFSSEQYDPQVPELR